MRCDAIAGGRGPLVDWTTGGVLYLRAVPEGWKRCPCGAGAGGCLFVGVCGTRPRRWEVTCSFAGVACNPIRGNLNAVAESRTGMAGPHVRGTTPASSVPVWPLCQ